MASTINTAGSAISSGEPLDELRLVAFELERVRVRLVLACEDAQRATRMQSEYFARVTHEICTPISALLGMAELLGETELCDDQRRVVSRIVANGLSTVDTVRRDLNPAHAADGQNALAAVEYDVRRILSRVRALLDPGARGERVSEHDESEIELFAGSRGAEKRLVRNDEKDGAAEEEKEENVGTTSN